MAKGMALTIGLNSVDPAHYAGWSGPLMACEADAHDMASIATTEGLLSTTLLTQAARCDAVLLLLKQAAATLTAGDLFVLSYSGHGGQLPDENADEFDDGQDETWCLYDGQLIDDQLYHAFGKFEAGVRIVVFSDSCHSGTVTKSFPRVDRGIHTGTWDIETRRMPLMAAFNTYHANRSRYDALLGDQKIRGSWQTISASVLLIAACQDNQTALDGTFNGLFTGNLLRTWNRGAFQGGYRALYETIARKSPTEHMPNYFKSGQPIDGFDTMRPFKV